MRYQNKHAYWLIHDTRAKQSKKAEARNRSSGCAYEAAPYLADFLAALPADLVLGALAVLVVVCLLLGGLALRFFALPALFFSNSAIDSAVTLAAGSQVGL